MNWETPQRKKFADDHVELLPLSETHIRDLASFALSHPEIFHHMFFGPFADEREFAEYIGETASREDALTWAVRSRRLNRFCGCVSLININSGFGEAELGSIWYDPAVHGSEVNSAAAGLLLEHLFDDLGYRRAVWKCDATNLPSARAALALGFSAEGIFRRHMIIKGRNRDTAWFSIIDGEWPEVRKRIDARIAAKAAAIGGTV
jgi:RimJ/RimL family protein N-acetyltransferase